MLEISCGFVLFTVKNNDVFYLLIKDSNGIYGFPKGHTEFGETGLETALRETWEETSIKPEIIDGFCSEIRYKLENGGIKTTTYYLGDFSNQTPKQNEAFEKFDFVILPFDKAYELLSFFDTKLLLEKANKFIYDNLLISDSSNT